jgi:hypothetical protein
LKYYASLVLRWSVRVARIESMIDNKVNLDASQRELLVEVERLTDTAHKLWHEGRYAETEPLFRRALSLQEQVWGADHPETADSLHALAHLHYTRGEHGDSARLYARG